MDAFPDQGLELDFAVDQELFAHTREFVRPGLSDIQSVGPHLFAVEQAHELSSGLNFN